MLGIPGRLAPEFLDALPWNPWTTCIGILGRLESESVDGMRRNAWTPSVGISGRNRPEYAHLATREAGQRAATSAFKRKSRDQDHVHQPRFPNPPPRERRTGDWRTFRHLPAGDYMLSIQASGEHYCTPQEILRAVEDYDRWEVTILTPAGSRVTPKTHPELLGPDEP